MERDIQTGNVSEALSLEPGVGKKAGEASRRRVVVGSVLQAEELKGDGETVFSNGAVKHPELGLGITMAAA